MNDDKIENAAKQLDRVLGFFSRVDAKGSFLFATNTAMIGVMATNFHKADMSVPVPMAAAFLCLVLLFLSLLYLYRAAFPSLSGGDSSLIYFGAISKLDEKQYIDALDSVSEKAWFNDMAAQIWRNSEILAAKFFAVKVSFILTAVALMPWTIFLILTSISHQAVVLAK